MLDDRLLLQSNLNPYAYHVFVHSLDETVIVSSCDALRNVVTCQVACTKLIIFQDTNQKVNSSVHRGVIRNV